MQGSLSGNNGVTESSDDGNVAVFVALFLVRRGLVGDFLPKD